jgi:putative Ca2+/H+ antiporter (TMEM165/GDT1 family)
VPSFFLALIAAALLSIGARDQVLVARLAMARSGGSGALIGVVVLVTALSSAAMAWGGAVVSAMLPSAAKSMLVAFALAAAAIELAWQRKDAAPKEPTHSLFALFVVLLARQIGDAARFAVFALAAAAGVPELSALGGWIGGAAVLMMAIVAADDLAHSPRLRPARWVLSGLCALAAIVIGLGARGLI